MRILVFSVEAIANWNPLSLFFVRNGRFLVTNRKSKQIRLARQEVFGFRLKEVKRGVIEHAQRAIVLDESVEDEADGNI